MDSDKTQWGSHGLTAGCKGFGIQELLAGTEQVCRCANEAGPCIYYFK